MDTFDELLLDVITDPARRALSVCPPAYPLAEQARIVQRAVAHACGLGLTVPRFALRWVAAGPDMQHGSTRRDQSGVLEVTLSVNVAPGSLFETMLHETMHLVDFGAYERRQLSPLQMEQRAIEFVGTAMGRR